MKGDDDAIRELAPLAPPCFPTRTMWLEYCDAALVHQRRRSTGIGPLVLLPAGQAVAFNTGFDFCADCSAAYQREMQRQSRCDPLHVERQLKGPR